MQRLLAHDTSRLVVWIVGTVVMLCAGALGGLLLTAPFIPNHDALSTLSIVGAVFGASAGAVQLWMLSLTQRNVIRVRGEWITVHIVIGALSAAVYLALIVPLTRPMADSERVSIGIGCLYGIACGLTVGGAQWYVIRPYLRQAGRWALATAVAWSVWWVLVAYVPRALHLLA